MTKREITAEEIREFLDYDQNTGILMWRQRPSKAVHIGAVAGSPDKFGYITIGFRGRVYKAHRLAWLHAHGVWPEGLIDHINGCKNDNRLCNLRVVGFAGNAQNIHRPNKRNKSGFLGVIWYQNKWRASITINRKTRWLGDYATPEEAHQAYVDAKRKHHLINFE